ncbi:hypothetical protein Bca4012_046606 [Brassica carinata]
MEEKLGMIFSRRRILIPRWRLRLGLDSARKKEFGAVYGNDTSTSSGNSTTKIKRCSGRVERSSEPAGKRPMSLSNIDLMERSKVTDVVSERFCGAGERSRSKN